VSDVLTAGDTELFTFLDEQFENVDGCDFDGCAEMATHLLVCPNDESAERMCTQHAADMRAQQAEVAQWPPFQQWNERIVFNQTCNEWIPLLDCIIRPIAVD